MLWAGRDQARPVAAGQTSTAKVTLLR